MENARSNPPPEKAVLTGRGTEMGRRAIKATETALSGAKLKPAYGGRPELRADYWRHLSAEFLQDDARRSNWTIYRIAFKVFYNEDLHDKSEHSAQYSDAETPSELAPFIGYLTASDYFFPSWEYSYSGPASGEFLHPRFRKKMDRYHEQWRKFASDRKGPAMSGNSDQAHAKSTPTGDGKPASSQHAMQRKQAVAVQKQENWASACQVEDGGVRNPRSGTLEIALE